MGVYFSRSAALKDSACSNVRGWRNQRKIEPHGKKCFTVFVYAAGYRSHLHAKFHHHTTSNKKDKKIGAAFKTIQGPGTKKRFLINLIIFHVGYRAGYPRFQI